ncbi:MAG: cation:dicarboxylase symporter family transporter [Treponema porcinum]|uniref:dicarboxylate/amino acid:cation symporter n=1 Tax=Treponema porcinum TaxID=261392 RepID=UPI0023548CC1|nr:cation:dicarboxylase symporter family transporter [Treponema porcinum]MCI6179033.1 cation:dicarboxylase symporter family transporter [Treponema porcinum]MCI6816802.1 cation:dicarboxylase symporter family transporter [Treponema porcinum]MCI6984069.1 cation:dicarboxylase symporter family transporter [Treponema porcinum]MCI7080284.1 cation:dicarboxylase symporter family transporter [Treponema porcinum]MCI7115505.1 cation:dicarboxylase symporter family transporter [Treponema porcinum]
MKLWIKYLIGALFGAVFAFILPLGNEQVAAAVSFVTEIVVRFGRYMVVPVVFFTAVIAFNRLRDTKMLFKTGIWTGGVIVASSLLLTVTGLLSILIVKLPRIPITVETVSESASLGVGDLIKSLLPYSAFETLNNGSFILAAFFFAMLVGTASTADPVLFKPVTQLADSLSKLMYNISVIFTEFLSVGMVAVLCSWTIQFRGVLTSGVFAPLILMLLVDFIFIAGVVYPLIIRYLCHDPHPYRILYASVCSVVTAFFSGDTNLVLQLNMRHGKESLGVRRRINGVVHPLFSIFARGGSALVTAISFIVIWRSYSSLSIPFTDILWITAVSFGISFLLGGFPAGGAFVSISVLCMLYSRGFENGFLLLKPAAPIICSFAAAFDALTAIFGSYIIAVKTKLVEHHGIKHYI